MRLNLGVGVCSSMVRIEHIRLLLHQFESQSMFLKCPWMAIVLPRAWNVMQKSLVGKGLKHLGKAFFYLIYLCQPLYPLHNVPGVCTFGTVAAWKIVFCSLYVEEENISLPTPTLALHGKTIVEEKEISFQVGSMYTLHALLEKSGWLHVYSTCTVRKIRWKK